MILLEAFFRMVEPLSLTVVLTVLGELSKRLGRATHAAHYYLWFYVASTLTFISAVARFLNTLLKLADSTQIQYDVVWILLYTGLPALGITIGVIVAWRYWSWLLAERD